ncbi:lysostaphin resistance A-like protein [Halosegnis sp.]|uniref:CPBP family intramembrane glutamic endopeptidase n=1 Tax=Halosegnis sp. TaxID=2864959 RepID=UPI0035D4C47F
MSRDTAALGTRGAQLRAVVTSLGLGFTGFVVGTVVFALVANLLTAVGVSVEENVVVRWGLSTVALQGAGLLVTSLVFFRVRDRFDLIRIRVPTRRDIGLMVAGLIVLGVLLAAITALYSRFGVQTPTTPLVEDGLETPALTLYLIPLTYLFVGPGEELMFRGAVQGLLRESYSAVPGVIVASAVFAVAHAGSVLGQPLEQKLAYFALIFTLSLVLGALYEVSDNLAVPIVVHGTYNALMFLQLYLASTGQVG